MNRKLVHVMLMLSIFTLGLAACSSTAPGATTTGDATDASVGSDARTCLDNTRNEGECKDCCDSLDADGAARKACRDACPTHDFAQNTGFITVDAPSILGPEGDYSLCTATGDAGSCKACCDDSAALQAGDRRRLRRPLVADGDAPL